MLTVKGWLRIMEKPKIVTKTLTLPLIGEP